MPVPLIPPALRELPITVEWRDPAPGRTTVVESLDAALELVRWGDELGDPVLAITLVTDDRIAGAELRALAGVTPPP